MQLQINNKQYDNYQFLEIKTGINIAVHAAILKFAPRYAEHFNIGDKVTIVAKDIILLMGKISTLDINNERVRMTVLSNTSAIKKRATQENKLKNITASGAISYIPELKTNGIKDKIIEQLNIPLNDEYAFLVDRIALKTGQRYYSLDETLYFFSSYRLETPTYISDGLINEKKIIKTSDNIFTYIIPSEAENAKKLGVQYKVFDRYSYSEDEKKIAVKTLNITEQEKAEYMILSVNLVYDVAYYPTQNIVLDGERYIVKTVRYLLDRNNKKCDLTLIKYKETAGLIPRL